MTDGRRGQLEPHRRSIHPIGCLETHVPRLQLIFCLPCDSFSRTSSISTSVMCVFTFSSTDLTCCCQSYCASPAGISSRYSFSHIFAVRLEISPRSCNVWSVTPQRNGLVRLCCHFRQVRIRSSGGNVHTGRSVYPLRPRVCELHALRFISRHNPLLHKTYLILAPCCP